MGALERVVSYTVHERGTKFSDKLSVLNDIISKLETIRVKIDDEDKALRVIYALPSSYEHMKPILMYGKETVVFLEVTSELFSEERRLSSGGGNVLPKDSTLAVDNGKGYSKKNIIH